MYISMSLNAFTHTDFIYIVQWDVINPYNHHLNQERENFCPPHGSLVLPCSQPPDTFICIIKKFWHAQVQNDQTFVSVGTGYVSNTK